MTNLHESAAFLRPGDYVIWRGSFGTADPVMVKVTGLHMILDRDKNHTVRKLSVAWAKFTGRNYLVDLENGHWAYAEQIEQTEASQSRSWSEPV